MRFTNSPFEGIAIQIREHKTAARLVLLVILALIMLNCWQFGVLYEMTSFKQIVEIPSSFEEQNVDYPFLVITDLDNSEEMKDVVEIDLSKGEKASAITAGGSYHLKGKMKGTLHIDAKEENVHLFLDGINIYSASGPAILCESAEKLIITLLPDTQNVISDSSNYPVDSQAQSCIFSVCNLTINGTGKLTVNGYRKDAIRSKDVLKIIDGIYVVKCKDTAFRGNDGVVVSGGEIDISAEKIGFKTTKRGGDGRGNLIICGGKINVLAGKYAFSAEKANLIVYSCEVNDKSIIETANVGGESHIQGGCIK